MLALRRIPELAPLELRREFDRLLGDFFGQPSGLGWDIRPFPAVNLWEDSERLMVEAEVPGFGMENLEILVQGNELSIKGQRKAAADGNLVYHRRERGTGEFVRAFTLPIEVDANRVEATLKDGVLRIVLPKSEAARARKIAVKTA